MSPSSSRSSLSGQADKRLGSNLAGEGGEAPRGTDHPCAHCAFVPGSSGLVGMRESTFVTSPVVT